MDAEGSTLFFDLVPSVVVDLTLVVALATEDSLTPGKRRRVDKTL